MTRRANYILGISLFLATMGAIAIALMVKSNSAGARVQPQPPEVTLGYPTYGGSGCPGGTARAVLSPSKDTLSILFDQYAAETSRGRTFDRKSCNLAVPIEVPRGWSVTLLSVDWRGFVKLPHGGDGTFRAEYFFAGETGPVLTRSYTGAIQTNVTLRDNVPLVKWSRCGETVIARVNSSATAEKPSPRAPDAMIVVDTADIEAGLLFHMRWRRCRH